MEQGTEKLAVLLDYLIKHNEEHAQEMKELAVGAQQVNNEKAMAAIERGMELLLQSNESLRAAYAALREG